MKNLFYAKLADIVLQLLATIIPFLYYTYREEDYVIVGIYFCLGAVQVISAICQIGKKSKFYWDRYRNGYNKALKVHIIFALIFGIILLLGILFLQALIYAVFIYLVIMLFSSWIFALFYFIISVMETRKLYFRAFHKPIIR